MISIRLVTLVAPLALALAACGTSGDTGGASLEGDPIAAIPAPEGTEWTDVVNVSPEGGYILGNPEAPLRLVEYASLTCSHCADFSENAGQALHDNYVAKGIVSYELRNQIHDGLDLTLNVLVRCGEPAAFHPLSEQVWSNLTNIGNKAKEVSDALKATAELPEDRKLIAVAQALDLIDFFAERGISREKAEACLADTKKAKEILERSETQSEELGVTGTPFFFLNDKSLESMTWRQLEPVLQKAGAR